MAFTAPAYAVNNIQTLDDLTENQASAVKILHDKAGSDTKAYLIALLAELASVTDSSSGADNIGVTPITETGAANKVQTIIEALITRLKAITDGASGADLIGATAISGLTGATAQALLESLKAYIDSVDEVSDLALTTHQTSADHDGRYFTETEMQATTDGASGADKTGVTAIPTLAGGTVQAVLESAKARFDDIDTVNVDAEVASTHLGADGGTYATLPIRLDSIDTELADYTHQSVNAMKASTATAGNRLKTSGYYAVNDGGGAEYVIQDSTTEPSSFYVTLTNGKKAVLVNNIVHPFQVGFKLDVAELDTVAKVDANWTILKNLIAHLKTSTREMVNFNNILTAHRVFAEWISGRSCPIGFYSDSTTDGATTTSHVSSVATTDPFLATITESPNAYPSKLEEYIKLVTGDALNPVRCYNGGYDGQSYAGGFGLRQWHNTWFRTAGSNVDFSDVKMIVLGFGTSDSINMDNTAVTIDNFSRDLECTIIDCFLRGVQPVIQAPVLTTQHVGTTVSYRNGDESVSIIETCQKELCKKYNLEYFSMAEPLVKALDGFSTFKYEDFISITDMVHPNDMGHRLHASYLVSKFNPNIAKIDNSKSYKHLFAGHPSYITTPAEIIAPASKNGTILIPITTDYYSDDSYYYNWVAADGNIKVEGDFLISVPVFIDKPTALYYVNIENRQAYNEGKQINIESLVLGSEITMRLLSEAAKQPEEVYFTNKHFTCLLPYGVNFITITANDNAVEQRFGGFYLADLEEHADFEFGRGSAGTAYVNQMIKVNPVTLKYTRKQVRRKDALKKYYNPADNIYTDICLTLGQNFVAGVTYQIFSHYNDVKGFQDCYNVLEIVTDVITLKTVNLAGSTTIFTQSITGLNALLIIGAKLKLSYRSQNYLPSGARFVFAVNGVEKHDLNTADVNAVWTEGYGFDAPDFLCHDIYISNRCGLYGFSIDYLL